MKPFTRNVLLSLLILAILLIAGQIEFDALQVNQVGEMNNATK